MTDQVTNSSDEISLKELLQKAGEWWRYLKTQWWKIALVGLIGGIIGFVYASRQPITYTSSLVFIVEESKSGGGGLANIASLAGQFGVDIGSSSGAGLLSGDNILLYFKSSSLAKEVLLSKVNNFSNQSFADIYAEVYNLKNSWRKNKKIGNVLFPPFSSTTKYTRLQDSLLQTIVSDISTSKFLISKLDKKAGFINVSVTMKDENLAKFYSERIVQIAIERYLSVKTMRQRSTVYKLQSRVDSIAGLLGKKTISGASLQTSSSTMDINPLYRSGTAVALETTLRDKSMLTTIFASALQNLEIAKFTLGQETPTIQIIDSPELPLKRNKKSRLFSAIIFSFLTGFGYIGLMLIRR